MAELVDAQDLKSCEIQPSCRFKSGLRHHFNNYSLVSDEFFYKLCSRFLKSVDIVKMFCYNQFVVWKDNWRNTQVWLKGPVLKTGRSRKRRRGSNPFSSAIVIICFIAGWSSSVARWAHNPKVVGSNPAPATMVPWCRGLSRLPVTQKIAGSNPVGTARWLHSSVGRAEDWKSLCRWFNSRWSHHISESNHYWMVFILSFTYRLYIISFFLWYYKIAFEYFCNHLYIFPINYKAVCLKCVFNKVRH